MTAAHEIRTAMLKADVVLTETARIEGSLRAIRDVAGMQGAQAAAQLRGSNEVGPGLSAPVHLLR